MGLKSPQRYIDPVEKLKKDSPEGEVVAEEVKKHQKSPQKGDDLDDTVEREFAPSSPFNLKKPMSRVAKGNSNITTVQSDLRMHP